MTSRLRCPTCDGHGQVLCDCFNYPLCGCSLDCPECGGYGSPRVETVRVTGGVL